jgi:hypothetical protein
MAKIAAIIGAATAVGTAIGLAGTVATVVGGAILVAGAVVVAKAVGKMFMPDMSAYSTQGSQGVLVNRTGSNVAIPVIYGKTRTGAARIFTHTEGTVGSGDDAIENAYMHLVYAISEGEINACKKIFFDGEEVMTTSATGANSSWTFTNSTYDGYVQAYFRPGTDSQTAISQLANCTTWSGSPRYRGIAYVYMRLEYNSEVFKNGLPEVTFLVEGKKVPSTSNPSSLSYSDNPARCILDYLTNTRYGKGIDPADIDLTTFQAAETYYSSKGFHVRGNLDTNANIYVNLLDLFTSCRSFLAFGNKYRLVAEKTESTVSLTLNDSNTVGDVTYALGDKKSMFNRLKAKFMNEATEYHDDIKIVESATLKSYDNGLVLEAEIPLPYTKTTSVAQQIMTEEINQSRQSHVVELTATVEAIDLQAGDIVQVTNSTFGITNKKFRVMSTEVHPSSEVGLILREYDPDVYGSSIITNYKGDN